MRVPISRKTLLALSLSFLFKSVEFLASALGLLCCVGFLSRFFVKWGSFLIWSMGCFSWLALLSLSTSCRRLDFSSCKNRDSVSLLALCSPMACGIFLTRVKPPCPLHWQTVPIHISPEVPVWHLFTMCGECGGEGKVAPTPALLWWKIHMRQRAWGCRSSVPSKELVTAQWLSSTQQQGVWNGICVLNLSFSNN